MLTALGCALALSAALPAGARADALISIPAAAAAAGAPGLELTGHTSPDGATALASGSAIRELRARGVSLRVLVGDLAAQDRADRAADRAFTARAGTSRLPSGRTEYRHLEDYERELDGLVTARPDLVKPIALGLPTLQGRTIKGVEITHDVGNQDGKPVLLMVGLHHAREWPSGEHTLEFAHDLVKNDGSDPQITALLSRARVIAIPVVNADGFVASREAPIDPQDSATSTAAGLEGNGTAYRRKNCRQTGGTGFTQAPIACDATLGVDLNRNYGTHWGSNGASSFDAAPDFRGLAPFSEPETEAIRRLVDTRQITMLITNHTSGNLVLYPPGVRSAGEVPDEAALKALGARFAAQNGYKLEHSFDLYDNSGTTEDFSYGVAGGFGFTFEINNINFHPAYERGVVDEYLGAGQYAGKGNRAAYLIALEAAADSATHAVLDGFAPPGRRLTVTRTVDSVTDPVCLTQPTGFFSTPCGPAGDVIPFSDRLTSSRVVGPDGAIDWHLNPSHAPAGLDDGQWRMTCSDPTTGEVLETRSFALARGQRLPTNLRCGEPPCAAPRALRPALAVAPAAGGRTLRISAALRASGAARGARIAVRLTRVASPRRATAARRVFTAAAGRTLRLRLRAARLRPGTYVASLSAKAARGGTDVRRRGFVVDGRGRVQRAPTFARTDGCRELQVARLASPAFGGTTDRALKLMVRLPAEATLRARVLRGGKTVATLAPRRVAGGRVVRVTLPGAKLRRGTYTVKITTVRGTAAARRTERVTLRARAV